MDEAVRFDDGVRVDQHDDVAGGQVLAWLLAAANPTFCGLATTCADGKRRATTATVSSDEALSITSTSRSITRAATRTDSSAAPMNGALLNVTVIVVSRWNLPTGRLSQPRGMTDRSTAASNA